MKRRLLFASAALALVGSPALAQVDGPAGKAAYVASSPAGFVAKTRLPTSTSTCEDGNSRLNQSGTVGLSGSRNWGPMMWAQALDGAGFDWDIATNYSVSGAVTGDVVTRLPAEIAANPQCGAWIIQLDINDPLTGVAWTTERANMATVQADVLGAGKALIWLGTPGVGSASFTGLRATTAQLQQIHQSAQWRAEQARNVPGVYNVDFCTVLCDPASAVGDLIDADTYDGKHPKPVGAELEGEAMLPVLAQLFPSRANWLLPNSNSDLYDATNNPRGSLNANPMMQGTTGTYGTNCSGASGLATSWACAGSSTTTGATFTASKTTDAAGNTLQRITFSGTPTGSTPTLDAIRQTGLQTKVATGDVLEAWASINLGAGLAGIQGVQLRIDYQLAGVTVQYCSWGDLHNAGYYIPASKPNLLAHIKCVTPNTATFDGLVFKVLVYMEQNTATGGYLEFRNVTLKKTNVVP